MVAEEAVPIPGQQRVRLRLQLLHRDATSWLPTSATVIAAACLEIELPPGSSLLSLQCKPLLIDVYEPASAIFAADAAHESEGPFDWWCLENCLHDIRAANCLAFIFISPSVRLLSVKIEQTIPECKLVSLTTGVSSRFADVGFEFCGRDHKWAVTWSKAFNASSDPESVSISSGFINVLQFGVRTEITPLNIWISDRLEEITTSQPLPEPDHLLSLNDLSPEILCRIVQHVPLQQRFSTLLTLSGTSRRLRQVFSHPSFYSTLDLKLSGLGNVNQIEFLKERSSQLRHLRMSHLASQNCFLVMSLTPALSSNTLVTVVANGCHSLNGDFLRLLCDYHHGSLQTLDVSHCVSIAPGAFVEIIKLDKLKRLSIGSTLIDRDSLLAIVSHCQNLEHLSAYSLAADAAIDQLCSLLSSNLRELDISCSDRLSSSGVETLARRCPDLEVLSLRRCGNRNVFLSSDLTHSCRTLVSCCRRLRVLGLPIFVNLDDLVSLCELQSSLEQLFIHQVVDASPFQIVSKNTYSPLYIFKY